MHVFTLVIAPGSPETAVAAAYAVLNRRTPREYDYAGVGGRFADRLLSVTETPERAAERARRVRDIDAWEARAEARRRAREEERAGRDHGGREAAGDDVAGVIDVEGLIEGIEEMDALLEDPRPPEPLDETDCIVEVEMLPRPVPDQLVPALYVTPNGNWHWRPLKEGQRERWIAAVNEALERHRKAHCVVVMDIHV